MPPRPYGLSSSVVLFFFSTGIVGRFFACFPPFIHRSGSERRKKPQRTESRLKTLLILILILILVLLFLSSTAGGSSRPDEVKAADGGAREGKVKVKKESSCSSHKVDCFLHPSLHTHSLARAKLLFIFPSLVLCFTWFLRIWLFFGMLVICSLSLLPLLVLDSARKHIDLADSHRSPSPSL